MRNHKGVHEVSIDRAIELKQCESELVKLENYLYRKYPNQINGESAVDMVIRLLDSVAD